MLVNILGVGERQNAAIKMLKRECMAVVRTTDEQCWE